MPRFQSLMRDPKSAFTLIELLIVIAIIAILAVVVVLVLNPAQLLAQSRDTNRVSDLTTLQSALNAYITDSAAGGQFFNLGNASSVYLSLPDTSSTCGSYTLPTLPSGYTYHCASSGSYRNVNGTGWIPVDFASTSFGSPLSSLPVDPTNNPNSCTYYAYVTNGRSFAISAGVESQKEKAALAQASGTFLDMLDVGTNTSLIPIDFASACGSSTSTSQGGGSLNTSSTLNAAPNTTSSFTFAGSTGESINLAFVNIIMSGSGCPTFTLTNPSGATMQNTGSCGGSFSWNNVILPSAGTYTVILNPGPSETVTSTIYLSDSLSFGAMPFDASTTISNKVYGQYISETFTGTAGQSLNFVWSSSWSSGCPTYILTSPSGTTLQNTGSCSSIWSWNNITLPTTGTYTVSLNPGTALVTSTAFIDVNTIATTTIPFNTSTTAANQYPGQIIPFSFTGTAGQSLNFVWSSSWSSGCPTYILTSPSGTTLQNTGSCSGIWSWNNIALPTTGTYSVTVQDGNALVTSTAFIDVNTIATTTIPFNTSTTAANQYPGQIIPFSFTGTAGQSLNFVWSSSWSSGCPTYILTSPSGTTLQNTGSCSGIWSWNNIALPTTGTYSVTVQDGNALVTSTAFIDVNTIATTTIPFNTSTTAANQYPGQIIPFSFTGTAGQSLNFVWSSSWSSGCPTYILTSPSGTTLQNTGSCSGIWSWNNIALPTTGTYSVTVQDGNALVTSTAFIDVNTIATTTIPFNTSTTAANQYPGQIIPFSFTGTAGQSLNFVWSSSWSSGCPTYILTSPSGTTLQNTGSCSGIWSWNNIALPTTGTYSVTVQDAYALVTSTAMISASANLGTLPVNTNTAFNNSEAGQYISMTFSAAANQVVNVSGSGIVRSGGNCPTFSLLNPSGGTIQSTGVCGGSFSLGSTTLSTAGTYTVSMNPGIDLVTSTLYLGE